MEELLVEVEAPHNEGEDSLPEFDEELYLTDGRDASSYEAGPGSE